MTEKQIIEINGIKMEVDLRYAKVIDNYKVGDHVKVLIKRYSDSYSTFSGIIVEFNQFQMLPTIVVCYADIDYSKAEIKFISINSQTKDCEIVHMSEVEKMEGRGRAVDMLNASVVKAQAELAELERKRDYFIENFDRHLVALNND